VPEERGLDGSHAERGFSSGPRSHSPNGPGPFQMHAPALVLGAAAAGSVPLASSMGCCGPGKSPQEAGVPWSRLAAVDRRDHHAPPGARAWSHLVVELQWSRPRLKEHGVPARIPTALLRKYARGTSSFAPGPAIVAGEPDPDVQRAFGVPPNQAASMPRAADDGGRMTDGGGAGSAMKLLITMPRVTARTATAMTPRASRPAGREARRRQARVQFIGGGSCYAQIPSRL
jgi:hypothetical protein